MHKKRLKKLLESYRVPLPEPAQLESIAEKMQAALPGRTGTQHFSLRRLMKVQASHLSKWFYLACFAATVFCFLFGYYVGPNHLASAFFAVGPLFILPCAWVLYRLFSDRMYELEASCKYNMVKILGCRMLLLGIFTLASVLVAWLVNAGIYRVWDLRHLLLALTSFLVTCAIILTFGKQSILRGMGGGALWAAAVVGLSLWKTSQRIIEALSLGAAMLITVAVACWLLWQAYCSLKKMSIGEHVLWNYALTE
ncbi:hypothetical protein LJC74_07115 [Eubacteriales bacterium OttesenSCG-928-A19]|nr:hypothetical protein [Eubacteriales bacterium OttesenSCG-928-A19]